jgi:hypothetical protein
MLLIEELHALCRSCSIVWVVKYTRFLYAKHVARMVEEKKEYIHNLDTGTGSTLLLVAFFVYYWC